MNYISSSEAYEKLQNNSDYILVDVRTEDEWNNVGFPKLENNFFKISSHLAPNYSLNPDFIEILENTIPSKDVHIMFMCRTNGRSAIAADLAEDADYENVYMITDGYEGSPAGDGWIKSNLPVEK